MSGFLSGLDALSTVSLENDGIVTWRGSEEKGARVTLTLPLTRIEDRKKGPRNK